jgi:sterol desaturase/sphingolipid hydroxylase (fatty acid hydroxylase superfamily)
MNTFLIILVGMFVMGIIELIFPNYKLPVKKGWLLRAVMFNIIQLAIVMLGYYTWECMLINKYSVFKLNLSPFTGGLVAYLINTWIFYWWHRLRHESKLMWLFVHQFHSRSYD